MTARRLLSLGIAGCTVAAAATPALAQPEMTYEPGNYEYARPAPVQPPMQPPVIYQQQPVVQSVPHDTYDDRGYDNRDYDDQRDYEKRGDYEVEEVYTTQAHHGGQSYHQAPHHQAPHHQAQGHHAYPPQPAFDREAWLDDCRAQYGRDRRGRGDGKLGGGILGAAVGGVIGNRVADGDRLAGTLIGAGVGGIAGAVLGSVISGSGDRRRAGDECEVYLDRYMAGGYGQQGYYGHGYGYGYAQGYTMQMTYVPVLVQVPQRAIVRETVREEWVEETRTVQHHTRPARPKKVHYQPAPAPKPVKVKTRYIKQR